MARFFQICCDGYDLPAELLLAVASRETNVTNIVGDNGHGYGIMQIDDRSFPDWCHSRLWKDPNAAISKGASVLDSKRETILQGQGKSLSFAGNHFVGKLDQSDAEILQTTVASYNCGMWADNLSLHKDIDLRTTGRNYSSDTLARMQPSTAHFRPSVSGLPTWFSG